MQAIVNKELIKRKARLGHVATVIGVVGLGVGFISSWRLAGAVEETDWGAVAMSYAALIVALVALTMGRYHVARWSRHPRADEVLAEALKSLDPRHSLLSYLPACPAEHLLITPHGLVVINAKHIFGQIRVRGRKWQRKLGWAQIFGSYSEGSLGNPTAEVERSVALVKERLTAALGDVAQAVPVDGVVVFTESRARVDVQDPATPVVDPKELRNYVRSLPSETKLQPDQLERVLSVFAPDRKRYQAEVAAPAPAKRGRRVPRKAANADMPKTARNRAERRMR